MRKLTAIALAGLLALSGVACADPESRGDGRADAPETRGIDAVLAAADAADSAGSARFDVTFLVSSVAQPTTMRIEGEEDFVEGVASATMSFDAADVPPGFDGPIEIIVAGRYAYFKGPLFAQVLRGAKWGRMDARKLGDSSLGFNAQPTQFLDWLRGASGDVRVVGEEVVRGASTVHYRAELTPEEIVDSARTREAADALRKQLKKLGDLEPIPVDVWIDSEGRPRRIDLEIDATLTGAGSVGGEISMELFDYGVDVDVEVPDDFRDITRLAS